MLIRRLAKQTISGQSHNENNRKGGSKVMNFVEEGVKASISSSINVGDCYMIQISEVLHPDLLEGATPSEDDLLYRVKGFKSCVFDKVGLEKLKKVPSSSAIKEAYTKGLDYSKTVIKKLFDLSGSDLKEIFPEVKGGSALSLLDVYTFEEIDKKISEYVPEFKVGDEVTLKTDETNRRMVSYVEKKDNGEVLYHCIAKDGKIFFINNTFLYKKTGRKYESVADYLKIIPLEDNNENN